MTSGVRRLSPWGLLALAGLLTSCGGGSGGGSTPAAPLAPQAPNIIIQSTGPRILDPKLDSASFDIDYTPMPLSQTCTLTVGVYSGTQEVHRIWGPYPVIGGTPLSVNWNGRNNTGQTFDPGLYHIRITATNDEGTDTQDHEIGIVRLAVRSIEFVDAGTGTNEFDMTYFKKGPQRSSSTLTTTAGPQFLNQKSSGEVSDADLDNGTARPVPLPNPDLDSPEMDGTNVNTDQFNRPIAYLMGTTPRCQVKFSADATSQQTSSGSASSGFPFSSYSIRAFCRVNNMQSATSDTLLPGVPVTMDFPVALPPWIARTPLPVEWGWEYEDGSDNWVEIPGTVTTQLLFYTILGTPEFRSSGTIYHPWVRVVDLISDWVGPSTDIDTQDELIEVIDHGIFQNLNVVYDSFGGGRSFYSSSPASGNVSYSIGAFLDGLDNGDKVNCLDCATTTTTFCNMMGIGEAQLLHISGSYQLNYIEGIGTGWTTEIFPNSGSHGFGWHEVTTITQGVSVIDNCLNVDIDGNPSVADAPNALRGWNVNRLWIEYQDLSRESGTMTPILDSKPYLYNN